MTWHMHEEIAGTFRYATKRLFDPPLDRDNGLSLDRDAICTILPHRDPFLFVDRVTVIDLERDLIIAAYDLTRGLEIFEGHFPVQPVWPGVLQVEAIGQVGCILNAVRSNGMGFETKTITATHILGARFVRPVRPGSDLEVRACLFEDSFFYTIVGQCLQDGAICSAAAVKILSTEE